MKLFEKLKPDFVCKDSRGNLVQLVQGGFCQVNILETKQGAVRGGHYHKTSKEAFFVVSGSVEVSFERDRKDCTQLFRKGDFFLVCPYTVHRMYFPQDCVLLAMYDRPVVKPDWTKDIYVKEEELAYERD